MPAVRTTKETQSPEGPSMPECDTPSYLELLAIAGIPVDWFDSVDQTVYEPKTVAPGEPIPRPSNPFILFRSCMCKLDKEQKTLGKAPKRQPAVSKLCGRLWRAAPLNVRAEFESRAEAADADHKLKYPNYTYSPKSAAEKAIEAAEKKQAKAAAAELSKEKVKGSGGSAGRRRGGGKGKGKASPDSHSPSSSSTTLDSPSSSHHATPIPNFFPDYSSWSYSGPPPLPPAMSYSAPQKVGVQFPQHLFGDSQFPQVNMPQHELDQSTVIPEQKRLAPGGLMPLQDMYPVESQSLVAAPQGVPDLSYGEYITPPNNGVAPYNESHSAPIDTTHTSNQIAALSLDLQSSTLQSDLPNTGLHKYFTPEELQSLIVEPQGVPDLSYGEYTLPHNNGVAPYNQSTSNNTTPHSNQTTVPSLDSNAPTFSLDAPDNLNNNYAGISENQHYFDFSKSYGLEPVASGSGSYSNWNPNAPGPSTGNAYIGNGYVGNVAYGNL